MVDVSLRLQRLSVALTLLEHDDPAAAEHVCQELLRHDRDDVEAQLILGLATGARGMTDAAAPILNRVGRARSDRAHPCSDLASMLIARGKADLAERQYRTCLTLTPGDLRLRYGLATFLRERGDADGAIALLEPVVSAHPDCAEAHDQMGLALAEAGRFGEAAEEFRQAITYDPAQAVFWANLGMMLKIQDQFDAAIAAYDEALVRAPNDRQIRVNRAVARLRAGRLAEAWEDEDWVLTEPGRCGLPPERLLLPLSRVPDLAGRTVLVVQEEGLGDALQFVRYVPMLAERGVRVVVAVGPALTRLMRTIPGVAEVPDGDAPVPRHDFHCSFNGLPRAFETTLETIPCNVPYIRAEPALVGNWAARLPSSCGLRIGLCWAGQARPWLQGFVGLDQRRSTSLTTLKALAAVPGVHFVSLQKGPAAAEVRAAGFELTDVMDDVRDFADTAAIVANLDLVVSVDTSVLHLAGAMGKPVLLLDRYDSCWRWLSGREDSPWYPSLRIFRQRQSGDWGPVIARVAQALTEAAGHPSRTPQCRDAA